MVITFNGLILCQYVPCDSPANCQNHGAWRPFYGQVRLSVVASCVIMCRLKEITKSRFLHTDFLQVDPRISGGAAHVTLELLRHTRIPSRPWSCFAGQVAVVAIAMGGLVLFNFVKPWFAKTCQRACAAAYDASRAP